MGLFFQKNIFHPWLPRSLQSFGLKYTCLKRYALFPQFTDAASLVLLKKKIIKSCSVIFRKFLRNNILIDRVIKRHLFSRCFRGSSSEKCYVVLRKTSSMRFSHRFTKGFHGTVSDISIEWYSKFLPQKKQHRCKEKVFFFVILYLYFFQCYP